MSGTLPRYGSLALGLLLLAFTSGCEDEVAAPTPPTTAAQKKPKPSSSAAASGSAAASKAPVDVFDENDFVESEDSRDPFRTYAHLYVRKPKVERRAQRKVKASEFSLDQLKLTAVVGRSRKMLMLTDPNGYGWMLRIGDFVGQSELVKAGGMEGEPVAINWRVDRIRARDVVFIREDAAHPDIAPTTRVVPLYPDPASGGG